MINPTPGFCLENQRKTFWTFSTKTNSCTRIMGCFDIHDRNTWLSLDGCRRNCFKNESAVEENTGVLPLGKLFKLVKVATSWIEYKPMKYHLLWIAKLYTTWSYNNSLTVCMTYVSIYKWRYDVIVINLNDVIYI